MLFNLSKKNNDEPLNITAMIDVVFLLLIFFICTASLQLPESEIKTALPGKSAVIPEFPPVELAISNAEGQLQVKCDGLLCQNDTELLQQISARSELADIPVVFAISDDVSFENIVHVMDICRQGGLKRLAIPLSDTN